MTALVSAHRAAGAGLAALVDAARLGVDFVELDVRALADGTLVVAHDARARGRAVRHLDGGQAKALGLVTLDEALAAVGPRVGIHLDLKVASWRPHDDEQSVEVRAVRTVLAGRRVEQVVVTTQIDRSVRLVRRWSRRHAPGLLVGLSLGRHVGGRWGTLMATPSERHPVRRLRRSDATLVVAQHLLAERGLADAAARAGLPLLVWTVDEPGLLQRWLSDDRAWLVTTNDPALALQLRSGAGQHSARP